MSDFFKSEMVRGDLQEMMELQQMCFKYAMSFPVLDNDRRAEYLEVLMSLLEKQEIMYARTVSYTHLTLPTILLV